VDADGRTCGSRHPGDERAPIELYLSVGDCSKGAIEVRLDCLNWQVEQLKRRLDGRDQRVVPLGQ
jgi:hypothetical protein